MPARDYYHDIVCHALQKDGWTITHDPYRIKLANIELIIDKDKTHYLLVEIGWENDRRIYSPFLHIDIINNKIWIQQDGTEEGIANELVKEGISPQQIVLAFKTPERRQITDFAIS